MASTNTYNVIDGDIILIKELTKQLKYTPGKTKDLINYAKKGIVAVESLLEEAISVVGGLKRSIENYEDFSDGSDAKKCTVTYNDVITGSRSITIGNVSLKRGCLRVMAADPFTGQVFYFKIPNKEVIGKHNLKINFSNRGGIPDKIKDKLLQSKGVNLWGEKIKVEANNFNERAWLIYRVNTFKELCK
jgi:hypothetical protein